MHILHLHNTVQAAIAVPLQAVLPAATAPPNALFRLMLLLLFLFLLLLLQLLPLELLLSLLLFLWLVGHPVRDEPLVQFSPFLSNHQRLCQTSQTH